MVHESVEQEKRKLSIIIRNFPETSDDRKEIEDLIKVKLGIPNAQISNIERIGTKPSEPTQPNKPRMVRTSVKDISTKWEILRKVRLLANHTDPSVRSTYIGADLTREQRTKEYDLRTEIRRRRH
jgi:hypothetical protein